MLVATARLTIHPSAAELPRAYFFEGLEKFLPGPLASLTRLSVVKPHNGRGIGTFLDRVRTRKARDLGAKSVAGICRPPRARALEKYCGFGILTEESSGKAIPEIKWCVAAKLLSFVMALQLLVAGRAAAEEPNIAAMKAEMCAAGDCRSAMSISEKLPTGPVGPLSMKKFGKPGMLTA